MPPKDFTAKKKSRVEVRAEREELRLALLQRQQQQLQHADGSSGSQQESPVLPLAMPTPSTHSTTGSTGTTGPAPPRRSIRCSFATSHPPIELGTAGASLSNKRRIVVVEKKTAAITKEKGRITEERVVGPSRGTRVPGLGSGVVKQPRRGPSQPAEPINEAVEEELVRIRANQKNMEERLQQQEWERDMERHERERERLAWEARMQAQFEEMARHMRMGAPPSDGSNSAP